MNGFLAQGYASATGTTTVLAMTSKAEYAPVPAPPLGRNWTDADVCAFHGFGSIELLMSMPGFPEPIPYPLRGRRWLPEAQFAFRESLIKAPLISSASVADAIPEIDLGAFMAEMRKEKVINRGSAA